MGAIKPSAMRRGIAPSEKINFVIECRVSGKWIGYLSGFTPSGLPVLVCGDETAMIFDRCEMADRITARLNCAGQEPVWETVELSGERRK